MSGSVLARPQASQLGDLQCPDLIISAQLNHNHRSRQRQTNEMGKRSVEQGVVRQSFSHGRTTPIFVVERRIAAPAGGKIVLHCPSCGATMRIVRITSKLGGTPKLTTRCQDCSEAYD
jgi:hypothetical protein